MKAYKETWLRNKEIIRNAGRWHRRGLLSDVQLTRLGEHYPVGFHESNGFLDIGLFIFTIVATSGAYFLLLNLLIDTSENQLGFHLFNLIFGVVVALLLGLLIKQKNFYRSGVDNALVAIATGLIVTSLVGFMPNNQPLWLYCLVSLPVLLLAVWYYGDTLVTFAAFLAVCTLMVDFVLDLPGGKTILPFVAMALAMVVYVVARRFDNKPELLYWTDDFVLLEWLSLVLLQMSSNYFVVRQVNNWLLERRLPEAPEISLPWLFWILTFVVPIALLVVGLRQKERPMMIMSAIGIAAAFSTWRYFYPIFSLETYLILNGFLLMIIAGVLIQYLRKPHNGFTDAPDEDSPDEFLLSPETITIIQSASTSLSHPSTDLKFGKGDFGGGGAGDKY
ncbi:hypothetical protein [Tellurirhabdus bombi]|uniref:hypothetical protein n=1 Tax=Tellurirhabdus bombi TaxID=2907205 RepID=UPI001F3D553E|nr:hypothetical protein [Tellurirhabdus bombi]